jgi:hypothetical protein
VRIWPIWPGGTSGLLCRDYKGKKADRLVTRIDPRVVSLVGDLRGHERQAAEELGQWKTHHEERKPPRCVGGGDYPGHHQRPAPATGQAAVPTLHEAGLPGEEAGREMLWFAQGSASGRKHFPPPPSPSRSSSRNARAGPQSGTGSAGRRHGLLDALRSPRLHGASTAAGLTEPPQRDERPPVQSGPGE